MTRIEFHPKDFIETEEGLIFAVCEIDEVIKLIRACKTREEAIEKLMQRRFRIPAGHAYAPLIPQKLIDASNADDGVALTRVQAEAINDGQRKFLHGRYASSRWRS